MRLEHVAARAGVGKATIYRRWASKEALAEDLLTQLAEPHIVIADTGNTRDELLAAVGNPMRAVSETDFGPVIRALLSQIASDPSIGDPFRATVVGARRAEIAKVINRRGRARRPPRGCRRRGRDRVAGRTRLFSADVRRCPRPRLRGARRRQLHARLRGLRGHPYDFKPPGRSPSRHQYQRTPGSPTGGP